MGKTGPASTGNATEKKPLGIDLPNTEEELFLLNNYPLLDINTGINNSGDQSILRELLNMMVKQELPLELQKIQLAYDKLDWDQIEKLAHKLKSGALYCGTVRLKFACQYLERYRKAGYSELLDKLYLQLISVANETEKSINHWIFSN
ncbi:sensory box histidine kinase/response regulator [Legionella nautarum]|uniref:Sensory box histidine kinase/response regulator n=1 Tax=Legionella nautarum TaxID=45070 RepID=A0A0W0WTS9_9GAMM|nr:Hpt domain-containing protein [Legionella nautarum]KTD35728.1 sensory box histidine kinase/response regulator [Legionella nautarum]